jgi:hypothetical protein
MVQQFQGERGEVGCGPAANSLDGLHGPAKPGKRGFFRRRGRAAEGGGLLNRYTVNIRIEGSNPSVSAIQLVYKGFLILDLGSGPLRPARLSGRLQTFCKRRPQI